MRSGAASISSFSRRSPSAPHTAGDRAQHPGALARTPGRQPGVALPGAPAARAPRRHRERVAIHREQPPGPLLHHHPAGPARAGRGSGPVEALRGGDQPGAGGRIVSRLQGLLARLRAVLRPGDAEGRMEEEFRFHLEMEQARLVRQGLPPDEARRQARLTFGGLDAHRETMRDERGAPWLGDRGADLRYALRAMRRSPGYALAVALTLGVGIGVNGMVGGYVNALLFRPIP